MQAAVILINPKRGMVAAKSSDNGIVIFELLGESEVQIGDVVSHPDFTSMGRETYRNIAQQQDVSVFVQNIVWSIEAAKKQCFLK